MQITRKDINAIANGFLEFYKGLGYEEILPANIVQDKDLSITFTNATIVPLKEKLIHGIKGMGYVVFQPCLRLKNLKRDNYNSAFTSYFRMVGLLSSPELKISEQVKNISDYLSNILLIDNKEVTIHSNEDTFELANNFSKEFKIQLNALAQKYYKWKYGVNDIFGLGITISIERNKISRELGNFVQIWKGTQIIGYEFGFGIETCYSILNGIPNNYFTLFGSNDTKKINDLFVSLCVIAEAASSNVKGSIFVNASIRKLKVELSYELFLNQFDTNIITISDESLYDVSKETVNKLLSELQERINNLNNSEKKIINYDMYLRESVIKGRTEKWAEDKLIQYIQKNNLKRLLQCSINEKIRKILNRLPNYDK